MARKRSKLDLMITAIHEAGHAVAAYQLGYTPTLVTIRARGENRGCTHYRRVRIHPNEDATSQCRKTEHATMIAYAGLIASTPPRLKSRGPATCPCDRVRRRSASASADGESLKSPAVFPGQHSSRAWRKDRSAECQSASVYPFKCERGPRRRSK